MFWTLYSIYCDLIAGENKGYLEKSQRTARGELKSWETRHWIKGKKPESFRKKKTDGRKYIQVLMKGY